MSIKYSGIVLALAFATLVSCSRDRPYIRGEVAGLQGDWVYLLRYIEQDGAVQKIDSVKTEGDNFAMALPDIVPDILYLGFENHPGYRLPFVADGRSVTVGGSMTYRGEITVDGTPQNDLLWQYIRRVRSVEVPRDAVQEALAPYADSTELADSAAFMRLATLRDSLDTRLTSVRRDFVAEYPSSITAAMVVAGEVTSSTPDGKVDSLIGELDTENMPDNVFLRRLRRRVAGEAR